MNFTLNRTSYSEFGIFSELEIEDLETKDKVILVAVTLEHAYQKDLAPNSWTYDAKLQPGAYKCVRGIHQLHNSPPFETFEITSVTGHTGILFHTGNYNKDSEGCVLLGRRVVPNPDGPGDMITSSKNTFLKFIDLTKGINEFTLTVTGL